MAKALNVGMIGYGFMGKAHSNAYRKVSYFFDLQHRPVLKAVCARSATLVMPQRAAETVAATSLEFI